MKISALLAGSALSGLAAALEWKGPLPTPVQELQLDDQGFTPKPTDGPGNERATLELARQKRDYVPSNYCGFVDGDADSIVSCSIGRTCMFYKFPTTKNIPGMRGCCEQENYVNCGWALDCIESAGFPQNCGDACQSDSFTLTDFFSPYCNKYTYLNPNIVDYGCGSTTYEGAATVSTTYEGAFAPSNSVRFATGVQLESQGALTRGGSATTSASAATSSISSSGTSNVPSAKSYPISIIIGCVIAGLFFLVVIAVLAVGCCMRHRRRKRRDAAIAALNNPQHAQAGPGTQYAPGYQPVQQQQPPLAPMQQQQQQAPVFYPPAGAEKGALSPNVNEVSPPAQNTAYFGAAGAPLPPQGPPPPIGSEMDATPQSTPMQGSPLPAYVQGSYVPPPPPQQPNLPPNTHQLHSESAAPMLNAQGQNVYEAPSGN